VVVLALGRVPSIDATGFVALESAIRRLGAARKSVILAGPLPQPRSVFDKANLPKHHDHVHFAETLERGLVLARDLLANGGSNAPASSGAPSSRSTIPGL
jgi:SulP family sulfate permease